MNKKILFSPVGGTDPISQKNGYEGALMQISRYWKPDVICLYMSKEILDIQEKDGGDGRYLYCLHKLEDTIDSNFDIRIIPREELEEVQLFDPIYKDFEKLLATIKEEMDETDELWLNISSGTPAMKSALLVLATMLDFPFKCIQVDTPSKKMNDHVHEGDWELEDFWDFDLDNEPNSVNRTHTEELLSLKTLKYEESIKKFISEYDYEAALKLAEDMKEKDTSPYINKLRIAKARRDLNNREVNEIIGTEDKEIYLPYETGDYRVLYEYILNLQAKVERKEYADFIRGLSPVFVSLFAAILKKNTSFDLNNYSYEDENGALRWNKHALNNSEYKDYLDNAYQQPFDSKYVSSDHLCELIQILVTADYIKDCVTDLRHVETQARNIAAHNMVFVDDNWILEKTGFTSKKIIGMIHKAVCYTDMNIKSISWDSYEIMNEDIIAALDRTNIG